MLLSSPAGNDLLFDEGLCEQGRNFANKIWNAFRLIKGWIVSEDVDVTKNDTAIEWFNAKLASEIKNINELYDQYRISEVLMATYKLVWDDFCSWYLEMVKPDFVDGSPLPVDSFTYNSTIEFFEDILKVLHPFMPFISEELWHLINEREKMDCLIAAEWPETSPVDSSILTEFSVASEIVTNVRNIRQQKGVSPKEKLTLFVKSSVKMSNRFDEIICKLSNLSSYELTGVKIEKSVSFLISNHEFFVPLSAVIDPDSEKERLKQELDYNMGFLKSVQAKLANERFVGNAKPEIVAVEKKKEADAIAKIKSIEEQLSGYSN